ncbi:MAG: sensor histidine kinase [Gammaproteobacteria bacterium]
MSNLLVNGFTSVSNKLVRLHRRLLPDASWAGWTPYLWLFYLAFFFAPWPGSMPWDLTKWILSIAATIVFLVLYFRSFSCDPRQLGGILFGIASLGYVFVFYTGTGHTFVIYAAALTSRYHNLRKSVPVMLAILGGFGIEAAVLYFMPDAAFAHSVWFWLPTLLMGSIIGLGSAWFADDITKRRLIDESQEEIRRLAASAERERIGRDLHDLLGHTLTLITVKAELAAKLAERDLRSAAHEIRALESISRDALRQVREAVGGYRSGGLAGEMAIARISLTAANVQLTSELNSANDFPAAHDHLLALVLREAVTNVIRHAAARHCSVRLSCDGTKTRLQIRDDGHGGNINPGNGIKGMRERLELLRGTLDIESDDDGTRVLASLPLNSSGQFDSMAIAK